MRRTPRQIIFAGAMAALLLAGAAPVLAQARLPHGGFAPIQGTVTLDDNVRLQVSTASGPVTIPLGPGTRVVRIVSGSTADLHANQLVDLHIVSGTTTVDRIFIEGMARPPGTHSGPPRHHGDFQPGPATSEADRATPHAHGTSGSQSANVDGQVISASGSSITVRTHWGRASYSISNSAIITKRITGSLADLAPGETVQISRGRDGTALTITIMSA